MQNILDEQFNPSEPDAVWVFDITYIWTLKIAPLSEQKSDGGAVFASLTYAAERILRTFFTAAGLLTANLNTLKDIAAKKSTFCQRSLFLRS